MASKWAEERWAQWCRAAGPMSVPELLDEVQKETAARCAEIADYCVGPAKDIRREFGLEE